MISIECPKCGRGGRVASDRANIRLVCKACHTVFHLDSAGRMILGEPESLEPKPTKPHKEEVSSIVDLDFAQTWRDIPAPVKYGVPAALLAAVVYLTVGFFGAGTPDYFRHAHLTARTLIDNDKSKAVSLATRSSAEAAGQWFDLMRSEIVKCRMDSSVRVDTALFNGNPEKDSSILLNVILSKPGSPENVQMSLPLLALADGTWALDANRALELAQGAAATSTPNK
jgi:hypothetical protein